MANRHSFLGSKGYLPCLLTLGVLFSQASAFGHVKWFSDFTFADEPLEYTEFITPVFWGLAILSVVVIVALTLLEEWVTKFKWVASIDQWFSQRSGHINYVMRIGVGITLLWCWQDGKLLAPDLVSLAEWATWFQFLVAALLVSPKTTPFAGVGILILYAVAIYQFGFFHMLDYLLIIGVGWFFIANYSKWESIKATALPGLYASLGFCLIWLGIEKMVYPSWAGLLLEEHPMLALGIDHDIFVLAAAFIEVSLGFMIMVCLQERLLALTITLVFVLTTLVFGREELVGHTLLHTVLIVFLFAGAGQATPPLHWISNIKLRIPATVIAFIGIVGFLMFPYSYGARLQYEAETAKLSAAHSGTVEVPSLGEAPGLSISLHKDPVAGWNLELFTDNFKFAPASAGLEPVQGEGHAHLLIDGKKIARLYSHWFHIQNLPAGHHEILVTLNANNHSMLTVDRKPVGASVEIDVLDRAN